MPRNQVLPARGLGHVALAISAAALWLSACGAAGPQLTSTAAVPTSSSSSPAASAATSADLPPAPAFRVTLFDGAEFDLATHLSRDGRPVVLNLWASWCPPCREEMPHFDAAARRHPEVLFLGVAVQDDPEDAAAAAGEMGITYPVGADVDGTVAGAFPYPGLPTTFLIGTDGLLIGAVYGGLGPEDIEDLIARYLQG
ncbi:MAG: TlpA family protein disulfide reductase [Acidimicrobiia bacterium]|nr:TlpA family protein disulfide reductase [Acidimicrobiia bacterium]